MRGDQLARQWRILRTIESKKQGTTVAELALQEDCSPRTIWRDLAAIQEAGFPLYSETNGQKSRYGFIEGYKFQLPVPFSVTKEILREISDSFQKERTYFTNDTLRTPYSFLLGL